MAHQLDYEGIARDYRDALRDDGYRPTVVLAQKWGVPVRTAHGRVREARRRGLLEALGELRPSRIQAVEQSRGEIARLKAALRICEMVLHSGGVVRSAIGSPQLEAWLHAAQQASSAHATDWTQARVLDDATDITDPAFPLRAAALEPDEHEFSVQE